MASFNFGLLELADGESGEAAVSVVVSKAKAEAAQAKEAAAAADSAATAGADKDKAVLKNFYFSKLQHDNGIRKFEKELKRLREVLIKLRREETKLMEKGEDGRYLIQLPEEQRELRLMQLPEEQRKLRQQQKKLREEEAKLMQLWKEFLLEHGFLAANEEEPEVPNDNNSGVDNVNGSVHSYHDGEPDVHPDGAYVYHERHVEDGYHYNNNGGRQGYHERHVEDGYHYNNNGGRQGYPEVHNKRKVQKYVEVKRPSSVERTEADHKRGETVTSDAGAEAERKPVENDQEETATPSNADAAPTTGSENSSAVGVSSSTNGQDVPRNREFKFIPKEKLSGSAKRKKRKATKKNGGNEAEKAKNQDSSEVDLSKKTDKEPMEAYPREEEKKTLAEYERIREEKKKSLEDVSRTEVRKVSAEEFSGLQLLEKKKLDDEEAVMKAEKVQNKAKEAVPKPQAEAKDAEDAKPKRVKPFPLEELSFAPPRRHLLSEDGSSHGGGASRGRFNGAGFQGRSRFNGEGFQGRSRINGDGFQGGSRDDSSDSRAPPAGRGGDNGRAAQNGAGNGAPRGGYSGGRGYGAPRGGYSGGRGDGAPRGDYSGGRGDGAQGGGYSGRGNGYQGNGGYHNQGGNGGGSVYQRRPGNDNYYRPRGRGNGRNTAPKPIVVEDMSSFPPLPAASAPARAAPLAVAPAAAPAPVSAPAPALS